MHVKCWTLDVLLNNERSSRVKVALAYNFLDFFDFWGYVNTVSSICILTRLYYPDILIRRKCSLLVYVLRIHLFVSFAYRWSLSVLILISQISFLIAMVWRTLIKLIRLQHTFTFDLCVKRKSNFFCKFAFRSRAFYHLRLCCTNLSLISSLFS